MELNVSADEHKDNGMEPSALVQRLLMLIPEQLTRDQDQTLTADAATGLEHSGLL